MSELILKRPAVEQKTGLSRSAIYAAMADNRFPRPIKIGVRAVGWLEADIHNWLEERILAREATK